MPKLICKQVMFYSLGDERSFFDFAKSIKGVRKVDGIGDEIHLHVSSRLSDVSLRAVLGLFQRYNIAMQQLRQFESARNAEWFKGDRKFWFTKTFQN